MGAFSSPPRSVSGFHPLARSPTLSTPFFLFLRQAPVSPPRRSGRRNQQRTAKTEEEALAAAAAASNMADTSRAAQLGDPRLLPARPLATGPRRPGPPRGTIERARARASPPGGPAHFGSRGPCPSPAPHLLAAAGASAAASWSALGATAKHCSKKIPNVPPASLGNIHVSVVSMWLGPFTRGLVAFQNFTGRWPKG